MGRRGVLGRAARGDQLRHTGQRREDDRRHLEWLAGVGDAMAEINLTAAFSTVPAPEQEAIRRLLTETIEQLAQEDRSFTRARVVFTESHERCGLTAELDAVK